MESTLYPPRSARPLKRNALDFLAILALLLIFLMLVLSASWQFWHANRIYSGVTIGGLPVGGQTRAAALMMLRRELYTYPLPPVAVTYDGHEWPLEASQVRADVNLLDAVNQAYLVGRQGSPIADLLAQMRAALLGASVTPPLSPNTTALHAAVSAIAAGVEMPGIPARQIGTVSVASESGLAVDVDATVQAITRALEDSNLYESAFVPLVTTEVAPPDSPDFVSGESLQLAGQRQPLLLRSAAAGIEYGLDPGEQAGFLLSTDPFQVDEEALNTYLNRLADQIDFPPRDARLRFNPVTGGLTLLQASRAGRALDVDGTAQAVIEAMRLGADEAPLAIVDVPPAVDMNRIAEMGIRELVISGSTYFAGSSLSRVRNIEVAADQFDGVVIPPDGIFSFNEIVRDVSSANGFEDSLIIWGDRTAVGVGGGVCQVSTTIFRAAYEGGFPIVQRYNHGYVVDWYGEPGLDATIFTPTVDFQFRNDTGAFLLVEPVVDAINGVITFNLYGTKPDRVVTISEPEITEVIEPETPSYVVDESLAPGAKQQVEWEKPGMTAKVTRSITEDGTTRTDTLVSQYQPWRAVYLVGPGTEIPATPTSTPGETSITSP